MCQSTIECLLWSPGKVGSQPMAGDRFDEVLDAKRPVDSGLPMTG